MSSPLFYCGVVVALFAILPFVLLGPQARRRWRAIDAASYALLAGLYFLSAWLGFDVDAATGVAAFAAIKLAVFSCFCATAPETEVHWDPTRAAVAAGLVYLALVPAMLRYPIDGDEPYYLLATESLLHDGDLDLANQYRDIAHFDGQRPDLVPQLGDPTGPHGQQYSRHEPLLSILMIPGYALFGVPGALATIALFGALLVRSTMRFFEEEGISTAAARIVFPFFAFGPPVIFFAARIWPEVPAAFLFVEALRGIRQRHALRAVPALLALVLLKLRFVPVAVLALAGLVLRRRPSRKAVAIGAAVLIVPLAAMWLISGSALNVHQLSELTPGRPLEYLKGLFGLVVDGAAGIAFQAPIYLAALLALTRWRTMPEGFRLGIAASSAYLFLLVPRPEWHGGWAPPLRYIAFLTPVLALGVAAAIDRLRAAGDRRELAFGMVLLAPAAAWTTMLVAHGVAFPYRLFQIASGENFVGETLSATYGSDFSRLFPSFIRPNAAGVVAAVAFVVVTIVAATRLDRWIRRTIPAQLLLPVAALLLTAGFVAGRAPGNVVELEDTHVTHDGGALYPEEYTVARFLYRGGWTLHAGESVSFLFRPGKATLRYSAATPATIELGGAAYQLPAAKDGTIAVLAAAEPRAIIRCTAGSVTLDQIRHD
jgi:hypothetical protein